MEPAQAATKRNGKVMCAKTVVLHSRKRWKWGSAKTARSRAFEGQYVIVAKTKASYTRSREPGKLGQKKKEGREEGSSARGAGPARAGSTGRRQNGWQDTTGDTEADKGGPGGGRNGFAIGGHPTGWDKRRF